MHILKNRVLWFTSYGLLITALFLYNLFPSDAVKSRLESGVNSPDFSLNIGSVRPSLPLGIKLINPVINYMARKDALFQGEALDIQPNWLSFFQKRSYISLSGRAYSGSFDGRIGFLSVDKAFPPPEGKLNFQNIDLSRCGFLKTEMGREITGKARGIIFYDNASDNYQNLAGAIELFLTKGSYSLAEPFLGLNRIEYESGEIRAKLNNGSLIIEKLEIFSPQINCSLKGEINMAVNLEQSRLNLTGVLEIMSKNKMKTNVTISGTLANPVSRYF
jgi:type II secretion system protein N